MGFRTMGCTRIPKKKIWQPWLLSTNWRCRHVLCWWPKCIVW